MKVAAFLGKWFAMSVAAWTAMWIIIAAMFFMADPFQNIGGIFPFPFGGWTIVGAIVLGLLITGIGETAKAKDDPEKQSKGEKPRANKDI